MDYLSIAMCSPKILTSPSGAGWLFWARKNIEDRCLNFPRRDGLDCRKSAFARGSSKRLPGCERGPQWIEMAPSILPALKSEPSP